MNTLLAADAGRLAMIALGASALALAINALRPAGLPLRYESAAVRLAAATTNTKEATRLISLEEMRDLMGRTGVLILDARPFVFFKAGHIPGALSLPKEAFAAQFPLLEAKLHDHDLTGVVIYCSGGDCEDSAAVAESLAARGIGPLAIFTGGWEEWTTSESSLPVEK